MTTRWARWAALIGVAVASSAHVGSPTVFYQGQAGPYAVRVIVRPPGVVPGLADISVRAPGTGMRRVLVQAVRWDLGLQGAPRPDQARPVPGDPALYSAELWLMTAGSYSVVVTLEGDAGSGTAVVPVASVATRRLAMPRLTGAALAALGAFLFAGAVTILGAAARESVLPPGEAPDAGRRRSGRRTALIGGVILGLALFGAKAWWDSVDAAYVANLYEPLQLTARVHEGEARVRRLRLAIDDPAWLERRVTPLIPDHGKLMHLFAVRAADLGAFAHLHPVPLDSSTFETTLPPVPEGRYWVYADIVHESGFAETLVDTVDLPAAAPTRHPPAPADPDDSWHLIGETSGNEQGRAKARAALGDGWVMTWERDSPLAAGQETTLRFFVTGPDGQPAILEPYLGMRGHAAVVREDGSVFVHLHSVGTVSVASQAAVTARIPTLTASAHQPHEPSAGVLEFPYEFPRPGRYRLWVQVKVNGQVWTGVFDART